MRRTLYSPDHEAYRETVREFLAREVVPHHPDWERNRRIDRDVFVSAAKAGIYALEIDERLNNLRDGSESIDTTGFGGDSDHVNAGFSKDESKDYVLLVTKQGRLLLNKKVEPANQTMTTQ